jgi:hypothetical protein
MTTWPQVGHRPWIGSNAPARIDSRERRMHYRARERQRASHLRGLPEDPAIVAQAAPGPLGPFPFADSDYPRALVPGAVTA